MRSWQQYLQVLNNFCHDLFTGVWGATWLLLYLMAKEAPPAAVGYWSDTLRRFFRLGPLSLVIVLVTGVLRTVWYQPRQNRVKDRLLIIKHLLLGLVFLVGSLSQYWLAYGK